MELKRYRTKLEILGDGKQIGSFIYIDDVTKATLITYKKSCEHFNTFNVGAKD